MHSHEIHENSHFIQEKNTVIALSLWGIDLGYRFVNQTYDVRVPEIKCQACTECLHTPSYTLSHFQVILHTWYNVCAVEIVVILRYLGINDEEKGSAQVIVFQIFSICDW